MTLVFFLHFHKNNGTNNFKEWKLLEKLELYAFLDVITRENYGSWHSVIWKSQLMLCTKSTHNFISKLSGLVCVFHLGKFRNVHAYI